MKRILIAGGTGFVGNQLIVYLAKKGYRLSVLSRNIKESKNNNIQYYHWDTLTGYIDKSAFDDVDTIINLTGANISTKKWTNKRKMQIIDSRINSISILYKYVKENNIQINKLISSSAVGYYGAISSDDIFYESSDNASDFLAKVCLLWEAEANTFSSLGTQVYILRKGVIIGEGGVYSKMAPLAKRYINTAFGNGNHYMPWIDIQDLISIYDFILGNKLDKGIYNAVATEHVTMNDFSYKLLKSFNKSSFLPNVPAFLIRLILGEMSSMLLTGTKVSNSKLLSYGFKFKFDYIQESFNNLNKN